MGLAAFVAVTAGEDRKASCGGCPEWGLPWCMCVSCWEPSACMYSQNFFESVPSNSGLMPTSWAQQAWQHHCRQLDAVPMPDNPVPEKHAVTPQLCAAASMQHRGGRSQEHCSHLAASLL